MINPAHTLSSVLIVGAEGAIARGLSVACAAEGIDVWRTTRRPEHVDNAAKSLLLDLSEPPEKWTLPPVGIDVVFICAAVSSQAQCESDPEATEKVNVLHTVQLARKLAAGGAFVVFLSTNLVLDGEAPFAGAGQPHNPKTAYGRQKAAAERQLLELDAQVAIVRFGKVIVPAMPLIDGWIRDLRAARPIHPFDDMVMAPISLPFAVEVLRRVALQRRADITQATAGSDITYAQAAALIARKLNADLALIEPVSYRQAGLDFAPRHAALDPASLVTLALEAPVPQQAFDLLFMAAEQVEEAS